MPSVYRGRYTKSSVSGPVAQIFPTTAQVIYDTLAADATFLGLIGSYEFKAGQTADAISIVTPGQDLPSIRNVTGVECVIQDTGNFRTLEYVSGDEPRVSITWSVFLVCWEPATGAEMQAAAQRACRHFLGSEAVQTVAVADGLGAAVQTKLLIKSDMPVVVF